MRLLPSVPPPKSTRHIWTHPTTAGQKRLGSLLTRCRSRRCVAPDLWGLPNGLTRTGNAPRFYALVAWRDFGVIPPVISRYRKPTAAGTGLVSRAVIHSRIIGKRWPTREELSRTQRFGPNFRMDDTASGSYISSPPNAHGVPGSAMPPFQVPLRRIPSRPIAQPVRHRCR